MKKAILVSSQKLLITESPELFCGPYDVMVAVQICGVCRADRKAFSIGQRDLVMPRVLGHEIVGLVKEIGIGVKNYNIGDRVQISPGVFCGSCEYCLSGTDHMCDSMRVIGFHLDGGFAETVLVPGGDKEPTILNKIPSHLDMHSAVLAEPLACSLNLLRRLNVEKAQSVVIFGAGPLGILTAQLVRCLSNAKIAVVEPLASRRAIVARFSDCQLDFDEQTRAHLLDFTGGRGVDIAIPCCPGDDPLAMAMQIAAKRGRIGFFCGLGKDGSIGNSALNQIHYREQTLTGAYGCTADDNRQALEILSRGQISLDGIPYRDISWSELSQTLSKSEPTEYIFTYFLPNVQ